MTKTEKLISKLESYFVGKGFAFKKSTKEFTKPFEFGAFRFMYEPFYQGEAVVWEYMIHFDIVEEILLNITKEKKNRLISTTRVNYEQLTKDPTVSRFHINSDELIDRAVDRTIELFEKYAEPYFYKYNTLEALDKMLNEENPFNAPALGNDKTQGGPIPIAYRGVIVAKLVGRTNYTELKHKYRDFISKYMDGKRLPDFDSILSYLEENDLSSFKKKYKVLV